MSDETSLKENRTVLKQLKFTPSEMEAYERFMEAEGFYNFPSLVHMALKHFTGSRAPVVEEVGRE